MKKLWKKLAVLATAACLALTCALLVACNNSGNNDGDKTDGQTTYTVTVKLPDGTAATGVQLAFCDATGVLPCNNPIMVNESGVASAKYDTMNYHVTVLAMSIPEGYELPSDWGKKNDGEKCYTDNWGGNSYTLQLVAKTAE